MKLKVLSIFSGAKNEDCSADNGSSSSMVTPVSKSSSGKEKSKRKKNTKGSKNPAVEEGEGRKELSLPKNCQIAEQFILAMNTYNIESPEDYIQSIADFYESEDTPIILEDGKRYRPLQCNQLLAVTHQSFPDFKFSYGEIKEVEKNNPNKVSVDAVYATGHHTGAPYTIMPGKLAVLEPSGKYCYNDEQFFILHFNEQGKICKFEVIAMGNCTGFAGFYTRAGGSLA
ncbi:hypothetical protein ACA910_006277 [Epithemia clementina (nom. ined.)]